VSEAIPTNRNGRLVILLIAGIPLTLVLAATWLWYFVVHGDLDLVGALGTSNRGELLQPPRQIADYPVQTDSGLAFILPGGDPKWTFVVPVSGACDAVCEGNLYTTRQIHLAMGKEFARIRRFLVAQGTVADLVFTAPALSDGAALPASLPDYLAGEQKGLTALQLDSVSYTGLFAGDYPPGTWFLMDPAGWVMMAYTPDIHYKEVISDLKFLLKNSNG
jgi:hypothetical protein